VEKHHAIADGFMLVGELAKKAGVTTRTLRYYDKEGLLSPSMESEGGYRLYSDKDMTKLAWILMMKQLGFGLSDIKNRLTRLDSPSDVINILTEQTTLLRNKVTQLSESINEIEALKSEIHQMNSVDFKKISGILVALQNNYANHWIIKYFDEDLLDMIGNKMSRDEAIAMSEIMNHLFNTAAKLQNENIAPESEKAQNFAKEFWEQMWEATGGDLNLIQKMNAQVIKIINEDENRNEIFVATHHFIQSAMEIYFRNMQDG